MGSVVFENVNNVLGELNRPKEYFFSRGKNSFMRSPGHRLPHPLAFSCAPFRRARIVRTPAFERIAREGVRFTHAFCARRGVHAITQRRAHRSADLADR